MFDHSPEGELRHAMEVARDYRLWESEGKPRMIGVIEAAIEKAFDTKEKSNPAEAASLRAAEHHFHHAFAALVKAQLDEMKHQAPLEDMDVFVGKFIASVDALRPFLPENTVPAPHDLRPHVYGMLREMEQNLPHGEDLFAAKVGRMADAAARNPASGWMKREKRTPSELILDAKRRQHAYSFLLARLGGAATPNNENDWVTEMKFGADSALSSARNALKTQHLVADLGDADDAQNKQHFIADLENALRQFDLDLDHFTSTAPKILTDEFSQAHVGDMYDAIGESVEKIRRLLPENEQANVPSAESFAKQRDSFLTRLRLALSSVETRSLPPAIVDDATSRLGLNPNRHDRGGEGGKNWGRNSGH